MPTTWVQQPTKPGVSALDPAVVLQHLGEQGVLAEVERLMAEDAAGTKRPSIHGVELQGLLDNA